MDKELTIGQKIRVLRKAKGLSVEEFAAKHNLNKANLYKWETGTKPSDPEDFIKLENILKLESVPHETDNQNQNGGPNYLKKRLNLKNTENPFLVPFVDVPAQAGYTKAYDQIDYIHTLQHYPILPNVDPHGGVWRYFQVEGDSMENPKKKPDDVVDPGLKDKDVILTSLVIKDDWTTFSNLYTYVVVTNDILTIKDVDREMFKEHGKWVLIPRNPIYEPTLIDIKDVKQLWLFRRRVTNTLPKAQMYNLEAIKKKLLSKIK